MVLTTIAPIQSQRGAARQRSDREEIAKARAPQARGGSLTNLVARRSLFSLKIALSRFYRAGAADLPTAPALEYPSANGRGARTLWALK